MDITNNSPRIIRFALCAIIAATTLTACTRHVSRGIAPDGQVDEVIFPPVDRIVLKEGTFPNVDNLVQIDRGVTKDQLYYLIGRPHFNEGFAAREWDYLFHLRQGDEIVTCQYKVIFDEAYRGRAFHWLPAGCDDLLKVDNPTAGGPQRFKISTDALFAFGRSGLNDIQPQGREDLAAIASQLKDADATIIQVVGHTDHIGSESDNRVLSQERARTVREFLVQNGVAADGLSAHGVGEAEPVKQCSDSSHDELVACLQPNRRVEVIVMGFQ